MLLLRIFLITPFVYLFDLTIAHGRLAAASQQATAVARSPYSPGDIKTPDIWTPPSLTPLGCKEPSTVPTLSNTHNSAPCSTTLPSRARDVVWKTFMVTITRPEAIPQPFSSIPIATGLKKDSRPLVGYSANEQAEYQIMGREVITVTSLLNSNGVPTAINTEEARGQHDTKSLAETNPKSTPNSVSTSISNSGPIQTTSGKSAGLKNVMISWLLLAIFCVGGIIFGL